MPYSLGDQQPLMLDPATKVETVSKYGIMVMAMPLIRAKNPGDQSIKVVHTIYTRKRITRQKMSDAWCC